MIKKSQENKELLGFIKESLADKVSDVKLTGKLKSHPVCLTSQGEISIEMEKVFGGIPNNGQTVKAQKVLEISAEHKILDTLKNLFESDKEKLKKYAIVLYEQARLLEGLNIESVSEFVSAMTEIM